MPRFSVVFFAIGVSLAEMNPNAVSGLASNMNTREIIGRFMEVEKRRIIPVEARRDQKLKELEAWGSVEAEIKKLHDLSKTLSKDDIWEAKTVESSDPTVILPTVNRGAKPGKTRIAVDSVALGHQLTSQGFESASSDVGTGKIVIKVGNADDEAPIDIPINQSNNTLEGMRQAINDSDLGLEAFVINTGSAEKPYQLMLSSLKTGERGRLHVRVELKGGMWNHRLMKALTRRR